MGYVSQLLAHAVLAVYPLNLYLLMTRAPSQIDAQMCADSRISHMVSSNKSLILWKADAAQDTVYGASFSERVLTVPRACKCC